MKQKLWKSLQRTLGKHGLFLSIGELDDDLSALREQRRERGKNNTTISYAVTRQVHRGGGQ